MKVCFVSREVAGVSGGGIGTYIAEAAKALTACGHEVWLLTEVPGEDRRHLLDTLPGFHRALITGFNVPESERNYFFHGGEHCYYSWLVHETLQRLDERFDYIEFPDYQGEGFVPFKEHRLFGSYGSSVLGLMLHSPMYECLYYDKQMHRVDLTLREQFKVEEDAIRDAPLINSPSEGLRDHVLQRLGLERDVEIIRYPMEIPGEAPAPPEPRTSLADLRFLYYGRIEPRKGVEELIDAFRELPELRIELIGGDVPFDPYGRSLRDCLKKTAPPNVEFVDAVDRPELLRRISRSDVVILPSLFENWPNACIEALAAGRIVVGSLHGGMAEMIEHGVTGFHVDGRSAEDIVRVIRDDVGGALGRLDEIGRAAMARIRELSDQQTYADALERRVRTFTESQPERPAIECESKKVTVVVPFYKDRDTIDEAVDSAVAQTHENLEILIVNDGSPLPDADEILSRQAAKDDRIRVIHKKNGGLGSARNRGIQEAAGEYLLFLDADNIVQPDYARTGVEVLERSHEAQFVTPLAEFFESGTRESRGIYNPLPIDRTTSLLINRFGDAGAFFRRSLFTELGFQYDEILIAYEDWALWMDIAGQGLRGEIVHHVLYNYRVRSDSMMAEEGLPNHPALLGLLIHRHYPGATPDEIDALTTIFATAGEAIGRVTFGPGDSASEPAPPSPPPSPSMSYPMQVPLRYKMVDELSRLSKKIPFVNKALRSILGALARLLRR